jgi:hypothetical protein
MTHDILQSDIDLARKLLDSGRPVTEIVAALAHRGIDSSRAAQLVADLQSAKPVVPDKPIEIRLRPKPAEITGSDPGRSRRTELPAQRTDRSQSRRKADGFPWFTIIALTSAALCVAAFVLISRKSHKSDSTDQAGSKSSYAPIGANQSRSRAGLDPKSISIEVAPDGLRLCGNLVSREGFLAGIFEILGPPARTNQVEKGDQIIYAYDACGLLVYSPKDSGHRSLVLDFDASDGPAGTKKAFVGPLKVDNHLVQASTDAASLGLIKGLELQSPKSASGIFRAQYGGLELVFGYLKTPERLSLVEIDFN